MIGEVCSVVGCLRFGCIVSTGEFWEAATQSPLGCNSLEIWGWRPSVERATPRGKSATGENEGCSGRAFELLVGMYAPCHHAPGGRLSRSERRRA